MEVEEEPPERFVLLLPPPKEDSIELEHEPEPEEEEEEEDIDPKCTQFNVKEEFQEDKVVAQTPTTDDQSHSMTNPRRQHAKKNRCSKCGLKFDTKSGLQRHLRLKKIHKCASCHAEFSCRLLRDRHLSEVHGGMLKCNKCSYQTDKAIRFTRHKWEHKKIRKKYYCPRCGLKLESKPSLQRHMSSSFIYKCASCFAEFPCKLLRDRHLSEVHGGMLKCDKCPYQTESAKFFGSHKWTHDKKISCETCQKKFAGQKSFRLHQMHHKHGIYAMTPEETFKCVTCNKLFSSPHYLKQHQRVHDEKKVKCKACGKVCKNKFSMGYHRQTHVEIECSICNQMVSKHSMAQHLLTHSAGLKFEKDDLQKQARSVANHTCAICKVKFSTKESLNRHESKLHGVVFKCDKCSYGANSKRHLIRHQGTHDKPFKCETCQLKFSMTPLLKSHQMQHRHGIYATAPEAAFTCDICNKPFLTPHYLSVHKRKTHDGRKAKCEICSKIFKNQQSLRTHSRTHKSQVFDKSNQLRAVPQPEPEDHFEPKLTQAEAQEEPSKKYFLVLKPKWVKSVKLAKFDAKWPGGSQLFESFLTFPHCHLFLKFQSCSENPVTKFTNFELPDHYFVNVKEEPTEEFVFVLPPEGDSLTQAEVKVESDI